MEIIEGKQTGTKIYVYDNYTYTVDKRFPHIYRCSKRKTVKCSGRIKKEREQYILICPHNHPEDPCVVQASNLKREMIRLCQETSEPLKDIFDTVCRTDVEAATYISYNNVKSTLSHYRALSRPIIPPDLHGLREQLENYEPTRSIYKGYAVSMDNKIVLIFSTDTLLQMLSESKEIYVDGTFSIVPKKPHIAQLEWCPSAPLPLNCTQYMYDMQVRALQLCLHYVKYVLPVFIKQCGTKLWNLHLVWNKI